MSNDLTPYEPQDDGWNDEANDASAKIIQGQLLKFSEGFWTFGQNATPVEDKFRLMAEATAAAWVRWEAGKPVEYRLRKGPWEDRGDLGYEDASSWEAGPDGKPRDPWQQTKFVYLTDLKTAEAYTFSTSSWSGRSAIEELASTIHRKRFSGRKALPMVELSKAQMKTKFGMKWKPVLKVVEWVYPDGEPGSKTVLATETNVPVERIKGDLQKVLPKMKTIAHDDMDDEIPFE